jgi:hypothetical protein
MLKALVAKYLSSWTAKLATAIMGAGVVVTINPQILEYIPEHWRGPFGTLIGLLVLLARLRKQLRPGAVAAILALSVVASGSAPRPALAAEMVTFVWLASTTGDDDAPLSSSNQVDRYGVTCARTLADLQAFNAAASVGVNAPDTTAAMMLDPGAWFCAVQAHNASGWSALSNVDSFTVADSSAPPPVAPRVPKRPAGFHHQ